MSVVPRVLLVDDHAPTVDALTQLLVRDGFDVAAFTSAAEACTELLRAPFDIVITDLDMPEVSGEEIIEVCVGNQPGACIVVITAWSHRPETALAARNACMVVSKPMNYPKLLERLAECRSDRALHRAGRRHLR